MFWKNLMVGQNLMVGHALLGGWKWSELPCSVIWHLPVIILMHWVFQFWLWGRFVAEKQTWVLILMSGHRPEMTYYENGEKKVCELDHYTDQSYLGIHYWDLVSKVAYPKLKKIEIQMSRHEKRYRSEEMSPPLPRLFCPTVEILFKLN